MISRAHYLRISPNCCRAVRCNGTFSFSFSFWTYFNFDFHFAVET